MSGPVIAAIVGFALATAGLLGIYISGIGGTCIAVVGMLIMIGDMVYVLITNRSSW